MLTLLPPPVEEHAQDRDVVLILDCSGSMQGDSLQLAKEGILLALASMQPSERFGLVAYGSNTITFNKQLQPANRKNIDMARRWVTSLGNMGGTNLYQAVEKALKFQEEQAIDILLLTDGEVWVDKGILGAMLNKGIRIFTVGIGSAVAQDVVQQLADDTGGACEMVSPTEDMSARIYRHFCRLHQPLMEALDIRWPDQPQWISQPERACFAGDAYTVFASFAEPPCGIATVTVNFSGQPTTEIEVPLVREAVVADAIVRLGAKQQLPQVPQVRRQDWAVRYQLMTDQTDYLITVERAEAQKPTDFPALQIQPHMLPAGWGGTSTVHAAGKIAHDNGIRYSRTSPPIAYDHVAEVPAVLLRCTRRPPTFADNGYKAFVSRIRTEAKKIIFGGLPTTRVELSTLALPLPLQTLIQELVAADIRDDDIVRAFYQAFIEHDGSVDIKGKLLEKMRAIVGSTPPIQELVSRILEVLNTLYNERYQGSMKDYYDIPAFLRNQAD